jgi:hypothetical protein
MKRIVTIIRLFQGSSWNSQNMSYNVRKEADNNATHFVCMHRKYM